MANDVNNSRSNKYREERKQAVEKTQKKQKARRKQHQKRNKILTRVISIVVAVAIVAGLGYTLGNHFGLAERLTTVMRVGEDKINGVVFDFYYMRTYQNIANQVNSIISTYGVNLYDFDLATPPSEQEYKSSDEYEYWSDFLQAQTLDTIQLYYSLYHEAIASGLEEFQTLTEEEQADVEETVKSLTESAKASGFSLNAYLRESYGKGFTEKTLRESIRIESIAQRYSETKQNDLLESYTDDFIQKKYTENRADYDVVSFRYYNFNATTLTQNEGESDDDFKVRQAAENKKAETDATAFFNKVTDSASFIREAAALNKETEDYDGDTATLKARTRLSAASSYITEDGGKWAYDAARKAGEKKMFGKDGAYAVVLITQPAYAVTPVDVRHILLTVADGTSAYSAASDADKNKVKAEAQALYNEWKAGDATVESFAAIASEKSVDNGSVDVGGLYENVGSGQMQPEFEEWILNEARKPGDTGLVETSYGWHIMYFVKAHTGDPSYKEEIRDAQMEEDYDAYVEKIYAQDNNKMTVNDASAKRFVARTEKMIAKMLRNSSAAA